MRKLLGMFVVFFVLSGCASSEKKAYDLWVDRMKFEFVVGVIDNYNDVSIRSTDGGFIVSGSVYGYRFLDLDPSYAKSWFLRSCFVPNGAKGALEVNCD